MFVIIHKQQIILSLIYKGKYMNKKYLLGIALLSLGVSAFAASVVPDAVLTDNMSKFEYVVLWSMKIGGVLCVITPIALFLANQLQGALARTFGVIIIVVGAVLIGTTLWIKEQASATSGLSSGFSIQKSNHSIRSKK